MLLLMQKIKKMIEIAKKSIKNAKKLHFFTVFIIKRRKNYEKTNSRQR